MTRAMVLLFPDPVEPTTKTPHRLSSSADGIHVASRVDKIKEFTEIGLTLHRFPSFHTDVTGGGFRGGGFRDGGVRTREVSQPIRAFC